MLLDMGTLVMVVVSMIGSLIRIQDHQKDGIWLAHWPDQKMAADKGTFKE